MVKVTVAGRVNDGLPLAQRAEENDSLLCYKKQAESILKEISRGALPPSKMTIRVDHQSLNYLVENGVCFMTLCDSSYPRKLAFHCLQGLQKELEKFDNTLIQKIIRPYSSLISKDLDIVSRNMSEILEGDEFQRCKNIGNLSLKLSLLYGVLHASRR